MSDGARMNNMTHSHAVGVIVAEYCKNERPEKRHPFIIWGPYDKSAVMKSEALEKPGCYAIYDENGSLRYIGMSESGIGYRARSHFSESTQESAFWKRGKAHFIELIQVQKSWEAPSLESYLTKATEEIRNKPLP